MLAFAQPCFDFAAVDFEQRPDQPFARHRQNPGEASQTRAAQDAIEHRLGLIGSGVAGGDAIHRAGGDQFGVERLPDVPRGFLQVAVDGRNVGLAKMERKAEISGQLRDEFSIGNRRRAANPVLDVDHAELEIPARSQARAAHAAGTRNPRRPTPRRRRVVPARTCDVVR